MSSIYGKNFKISIFGESHQKIIGTVIDSGVSGIELDLDKIKQSLKRRSSDGENYETPRNEPDDFEIVSGFYNGKTTGAPITIIIKNKDIKNKDYSFVHEIFRPSHSDYTSFLHYFGNSDMAGGGHFSGRLTSLMVICGEIAKQILQKKYDIIFLSHISSIENIQERNFNTDDFKIENIHKILNSHFPILDKNCLEKMQHSLKKAKQDGDSVGGKIETAILNVPRGIGEEIFDSLESQIAHLIFSIPSVKSIEFGNPNITKLRGSVANDSYYYDENKNLKLEQNNSGGILGGISNGEPIIFTTGIKPISSISKVQKSVNYVNKENTELEIKGRHDSSIIKRVIPVIESMAAVAIIDSLMSEKGREFFCEKSADFLKFEKNN